MMYLEMKRKCPICDTRSDVSVSKCRTCGYEFSPGGSSDTSHVVRLDSSGSRKRKKFIATSVTALAAVVIVLTFFIMGGSRGTPDLDAGLNNSVTLYTYSHFTVVIVQLNGWITNYGDADSRALVEIDVYDGSEWLGYDVPTDEISKDGGMLWFQWSQEYTNADESGFEVRYEVTPI